MFNDIYRNKKVLVTGHTGFKGAWLSLWLAQLGAEVHGFSIGIPTSPSLFEAGEIAEVANDHRGEIRCSETVSKLIGEIRPDFVFHLAAQPIVKRSYEDPRETFETNVMGTLNVLESIRQVNQPCIAVMITSDKCYENVEWTWGYRENDPLGGKDPYSASKAAAECVIHSMFHSYFRQSDIMRLVSVRAGNVIGGGDWAANRIVPDAMRSWAEGEPVIIRSPHSTRPWQHVLEPLSGYLKAGQMLSENPGLSGEAFNFGPLASQSHTVLELLEVLARGWGFAKDARMVQVDKEVSFHEAGLLKLNCDKALHKLSWKPTLRFEQTTAFTSEWFHHFYKNASIQPMQEYTIGQIDAYVTEAFKQDQAWTQ